jgi:hypothetical protein
MTTSTLMPAPGYVLVELGVKYSEVDTPEERYNTQTSGICVAGKSDWSGKKVFWEEFNASNRISANGHIFAFIKKEDIRGYETGETAD